MKTFQLPQNLTEWLDYQTSLHPQNIELGLERVQQVWQALGAPKLARKVITVAGTNGKGSCVAMLDSIIRAASYSVGTYTSPHLLVYNERICLDGKPVSEQTLCAAFAAIEQARGEIPLTYFEFGTLAALWIFSQQDLDIVLLEVGLGGRLDAVNIIDTDVALVTGIAMDHMDWLGDNLESIGAEKAGIFRADRPAIYASLTMPNSIQEASEKVGANLLRLNIDYHYQVEPDAWHWSSQTNYRRSLPLPNLRGSMQLQNAAAVLQVLESIQADFPVSQADVRRGLLSVQLPGRMAIYQRKARWILDVAHNVQAIETLSKQISQMYVPGKVIAVVGVLHDKLRAELFSAISARIDIWYLLDLSDEFRGASAEQLQQVLNVKDAQACGKPGLCFDLIEQNTDADDLVLVFGSFVTVAATMRWLAR